MTAEPVQVGRQTWSADGYAHNARFVADLAGGVLSWLNLKPGERILDLGCGDGALTEKLVAGGADVVGCDASSALVDAARARGLDASIADARALPYDNEFDAVFSNAVLHWVKPPQDAVRGVFQALKPKGRFVAEFGGHGNVAAIITAMRAVAKSRNGDADLAHPWYFPTPEAYASLLEREGFQVVRSELVPRPTPLPTGLRGWIATFRQPFFDQFEGAERDAALNDVEELLGPSLCDDRGQWTADYVRVRVEATRP